MYTGVVIDVLLQIAAVAADLIFAVVSNIVSERVGNGDKDGE